MLDQARLFLAAARVYRDPNRLDEVLEAATRLARGNDMKRLTTHFREKSADAATALAERRLIEVDIARLSACPEGSLGRAVADHCTRWGIDPATFPRRPNSTPEEYVIAHIENTHDVWHPVTGFGNDVPGELGLQAFYLAQFPNLLGLLLLSIFHFKALRDPAHEYEAFMDEIARGWIMGKRAKPLFGVRWDQWWERPLDDVRRELNLPTASEARSLAA